MAGLLTEQMFQIPQQLMQIPTGMTTEQMFQQPQETMPIPQGEQPGAGSVLMDLLKGLNLSVNFGTGGGGGANVNAQAGGNQGILAMLQALAKKKKGLRNGPRQTGSDEPSAGWAEPSGPPSPRMY